MSNVKVLFKEQGDFFILQGTDGLYICMIWPAGHLDEEKCFKLKDDDLIKYSDYHEMVSLAKEIRGNYALYKAQEVPVMQESTAREYIDKALSLARKRRQAISENPTAAALEPMYDSIVEQLSYLRNIVDGSESDKTRLRKLTFGLYAVREFETSDEIFFQRLTDAFYIASQLSSGLKVKLPHEVNDKYMQREQRLCKLYPDDFYIR